MSKILHLLLKVHDSVHDFDMTIQKQYSEPKIYTGGVDITKWGKLTAAEKAEALSKDWYIRYSYRYPDGKLKRMPNIKGWANSYKTKPERFEILNTLRKNLKTLLRTGFNPLKPENYGDEVPEIKTVKQAFKAALDIKKVTLAETSYNNFEGRIKRFQKWLVSNGYENRVITSITPITVNNYLNEVLKKTSPSTRNNTRLDISALFSTMKSQFLVPANVVESIGVLKSTPERNKSYTLDQEDKVFARMNEKDPLLSLFVKVVAWGFLRPVEASRLRIKDVNKSERIFTVLVKNGSVETIIIPELLLNELPDLSGYDSEDFLFTPTGPGEWKSKESDRRGYWGKRFDKVVKKELKLGNEYNIYSFRHTYTSKLYMSVIETMTPNEAESYLMTITRHKTREALRKYLRNIGAYRPEDFSKHLTK